MNSPAGLLEPFHEPIQGLQEVGHHFWTRGWSLGTSSNYSVVVDRQPLRLLITASGKDKGHLGPNDFVIVDNIGQRTPAEQPASSAETLLHCSIAERRGAGAVLHTHSVWGTILSDHFAQLGGITLEGFEMLKGLEGIKSHESRVWLPIFENTQDIPKLREQVEQMWKENPDRPCWGYLIRRHGMYTWGSNLSEASRHVEVIEFLLECVGRTIALP
ncbi:MAG: methylthioribulose 1-phosphate dehydratase [Pirellulaceae bacterium]|nr:methylthioribulose 1-phosphate dehydratase [Pirellulaceae bacterium]